MQLLERGSTRRVEAAFATACFIIKSIESVEREMKEAESELMGLHPENVIVGPGGRRWFGDMGMDRTGGMGGGQGMM